MHLTVARDSGALHKYCQHTLERVQIDKDIVDLLDTMEEVLNLAPDAQTLTQHCNLSNKRKMLVLLMNQLIECGYFIQSYAKDRNSCMSFVCSSYID